MKLLGDLARIAAAAATGFMRATLGEPDLAVGIVLSIQTHGSLLNWQPHIHALVTNGGFRADGTFVRLPAHSPEVLTEAFRRGVLKLFVERELFEPEVADGTLDWLHSSFSVHDGVWLDQDDAAAHERLAGSPRGPQAAWGALARYCARYPVSLERLEYDAQAGRMAYTSDKTDSAAAGRHTFEATAFIARLVAHIPDKGQVLQRTYGYFANRTRGEPRKAAQAGGGETNGGLNATADTQLPVADVTNFSRPEARRRWAQLLHPTRLRRAGTPGLRPIYEVDPLVCPKCGGQMRVIALIHEPKVIDKILRHVRAKGRDARAGPWATGPPASTADAAEATGGPQIKH